MGQINSISVGKLKFLLKRIGLFSKINAYYKSLMTRRVLEKLKMDYTTLAAERGVEHDEEEALLRFKRRHNELKPEFQPKKIGDLRLFWVGTSLNQDNSGFLQTLSDLAKVTAFYNHTGEYGLWNNAGTAAIYDADVIKLNDDALKRQIESAIQKGGIDALMGQMWAGRISKEVIAWVRSKGIPVINISMDDRLPEHWGYSGNIRLGSVGLANSLDMVLTTSSETCLWYTVEGCPVINWPLASDPNLFYKKYNQPRDIEVLFIGNKYGVRGKIVNKLISSGIDVTAYGNGWPNGTSSFEKSIELSNRSKIILGIGTVGHCADLFTMKLRDFDAPMSGALYITHRNPDLTSLYKEGEEIEFYLTVDEAISKIRFYLQNPDELSRVAFNGQNKALKNYTWHNRLLGTFRRLGLIEDSYNT
jgi:spore maturation protein CgeB